MHGPAEPPPDPPAAPSDPPVEAPDAHSAAPDAPEATTDAPDAPDVALGPPAQPAAPAGHVPDPPSDSIDPLAAASPGPVSAGLPSEQPATAAADGAGRVARNTAIFSVATGISRVAGLVREIAVAKFFGTSPAFSAFTIANQVPTLVTNLFANAALSAAFVPVFTELLHQGRRKEALRLASTLFWIMLIVLGAIMSFFILGAGVIMPLFTGVKFNAYLDGLTVGFSQVLFPVVLLLGLNGLLVGILQSYDHFTIPAIAPAVWNLVILVLLLSLRPRFHTEEAQLYLYAVSILIATIVQLLMAGAALSRIDFRLGFHVDWHDPRIRRVFSLMLPVTIGLGIVNLDQLINSVFGTLVSAEAPRAIDNAFRVYMLPQGLFSVAVATVLFPTLSRMAAGRDVRSMRRAVGIGMRQINLLLIPAAAFMVVLATPIVRLLFQRGNFGPHSTHIVSVALFWFAFSLPFGGINLLLTRTFFAVQRPWIPTRLAAVNIVVDIIVSVALYKPFGIAGLIIGTVAANAVMTWLQLQRLRVGFNGRLEGAQTTMITMRILVASGLLAGVSWTVWYVIDHLLGRSLPAQILSVGAAVVAGGLVYARAVLVMHVPEAHQVSRLVRAQLGMAAPRPPRR